MFSFIFSPEWSMSLKPPNESESDIILYSGDKERHFQWTSLLRVSCLFRDFIISQFIIFYRQNSRLIGRKKICATIVWEVHDWVLVIILVRTCIEYSEPYVTNHLLLLPSPIPSHKTPTNSQPVAATLHMPYSICFRWVLFVKASSGLLPVPATSLNAQQPPTSTSRLKP